MTYAVPVSVSFPFSRVGDRHGVTRFHVRQIGRAAREIVRRNEDADLRIVISQQGLKRVFSDSRYKADSRFAFGEANGSAVRHGKFGGLGRRILRKIVFVNIGLRRRFPFRLCRFSRKEEETGKNAREREQRRGKPFLGFRHLSFLLYFHAFQLSG